MNYKLKTKAMKATTIQDKTTLKIIMWFVDGVRVSQQRYDEHTRNMRGYNTSYTTYTKSGNYKHVFYLSN